jgi:hypothetical protein
MDDHPYMSRRALMMAAAVLLGAAAGAKAADNVIGGKGLPSILAQLGGAILGGTFGMALVGAIRENQEK